MDVHGFDVCTLTPPERTILISTLERMLGSLTTYQTLLKKHYYGEARLRPDGSLPIFGAGMAGIGAGLTVSFIAAPVEHVKARLQVQYHDARKHHVKVGSPSNIFYTGPIDCIKKLVSINFSRLQLRLIDRME